MSSDILANKQKKSTERFEAYKAKACCIQSWSEQIFIFILSTRKYTNTYPWTTSYATSFKKGDVWNSDCQDFQWIMPIAAFKLIQWQPSCQTEHPSVVHIPSTGNLHVVTERGVGGQVTILYYITHIYDSMLQINWLILSSLFRIILFFIMCNAADSGCMHHSHNVECHLKNNEVTYTHMNSGSIMRLWTLP